MQVQGIGVRQASFYIAWSEEYENQGNCREADQIYQKGLQACAEPHEKLLQFHKYGVMHSNLCFICLKIGIFIVKAWLFCVYRALQARVSRQVMMNLEQGDSDDEPKQTERVHLADLKYKGKKKAIKPINRTGSAIRSKCNV